MSRTLLACVIAVVCAADAAAQATLNEGGFRSAAEHAPRPAYPAALVAKRISGVAVASVLVDTAGKVAVVVVLEAPDPLMAESIRTTVQQWTFRPVTARRGADGAFQPVEVTSKLTFYFQIRNGVGVVLNPDEMPGGPVIRREPPGGPPTPPPAAAPMVRRGGPDISALQIDAAEFERRAALTGTVVLDPREREEVRRTGRPGALNIPRDEVPIRARIEIPPRTSVIVDCSRANDFTCMVAATRLVEAGFRVSVFKP
jgi:rhodanese-related sulfurtransferase